MVLTPHPPSTLSYTNGISSTYVPSSRKYSLSTTTTTNNNKLIQFKAMQWVILLSALHYVWCPKSAFRSQTHNGLQKGVWLVGHDLWWKSATSNLKNIRITPSNLEHVCGDDGEPLWVISHSLQIGVPTEDNLEDVQDESQGILVQEVHLERKLGE